MNDTTQAREVTAEFRKKLSGMRKLNGDATTAEEFAPGFTGGGDKEKASQGEEWGLRSKA